MKLIKNIIYIGVILLSSCTTLYELDNKQNIFLKPGEIKYLKPGLLIGTGNNNIQI